MCVEQVDLKARNCLADRCACALRIDVDSRQRAISDVYCCFRDSVHVYQSGRLIAVAIKPGRKHCGFSDSPPKIT